MKRKSLEEIFMDGKRLKQSWKKIGWNNPNYGKPRDEETKQKISDSLKDYHANISPVDDKDK
ncbi:MAG: hypothetical protein LBU84_17895 [Prevotella sp.]|jgi:hypothetical protein|nr:hypothetical protein [Prevotella sp.]